MYSELFEIYVMWMSGYLEGLSLHCPSNEFSALQLRMIQRCQSLPSSAIHPGP